MAGRDLVVSFGEMLIDFVPTVRPLSLEEAPVLVGRGHSDVVPSYVPAPGGAPANVAIAVARLGGKAAFVGKLGADEFGQGLANVLKENNVDVSGVVYETEALTALAFVSLRSDGERSFMFYRNPSADMLLRPQDLNVDLLKKAAVFHYGSISLIKDPCRSAHLEAMKIAKEAGALLSYDPNLREKLWPSKEEARTQILKIWDDADIVKISEAELQFLTTDDLEKELLGPDEYEVKDEVVNRLWRDTFKLLIVTLGDKGCVYYTKNFKGMVKSFKIEQVDSTGAGDSFVGALLQGFIKDHSAFEDQAKLEGVLRFANACGAITATKRGAIPSLPTELEVTEVLLKHTHA